MQEKNYTNPLDRGRFGFSRSGEFRAPFKAEGFLMGLLILIALGLGVGLFFLSSGIIKQNKAENSNETTFVAGITIVISGAILLVLLALLGVGLRFIRKGMRCQYTANDETFSATIGGDLHVINYKDVQGISFKSRTVFRKIRGYDIIIKTGGGEKRFSVCSEGYLSAKSTPFYIIQERLDLSRQPSSAPQGYASSHSPSGTGGNAISRAELERARKEGTMSALDRMAQLLGESSDMEELESSNEYDVESYFSGTPHYSVGNMPEVGHRANFDMSGGQSGSSRDISMRAVISSGTFYVEPSITKVILLITIILGAWAAFVFGFMYAAETYIDLKIEEQTKQLIIYAGLIPSELILLVMLVTKIHGPQYSFKADGRGLFITPKGKPEQQILYKDAISLDYKLTKLLGAARGYRVEILTKDGIIVYKYMFPGFNRKVSKKYLPFEPLRKYLEDKEKKDAPEEDN